MRPYMRSFDPAKTGFIADDTRELSDLNKVFLISNRSGHAQIIRAELTR